ncbi:MAG: ABC transporter ATP-binding protein [Pseudomonadota bacterium]
MTPLAEQAVDVRSVSYSPFGLKNADPLVADVSFSVAHGECVALVGPNGAGKTTLIRMLCGLARPTNGDVLIGGQSIAKMSHADRAKRIAYVGQSDEPDGRLTVRDYVALGFVTHARSFAGNTGRHHAENALETVKLTHLADRRLGGLSGGERQRAKIARALCQEPSVLILDEPTNHLDPQARGEQLALVGSLGITVIAALHDLTLIDAFADKVAVLSGGRLLGFGPPSEAISTAKVREVFGVDLHRLPHPNQNYDLPTLDIPLARSAPSIPSVPQ